jgi:hypothetical protein
MVIVTTPEGTSADVTGVESESREQSAKNVPFQHVTSRRLTQRIPLRLML